MKPLAGTIGTLDHLHGYSWLTQIQRGRERSKRINEPSDMKRPDRGGHLYETPIPIPRHKLLFPLPLLATIVDVKRVRARVYIRYTRADTAACFEDQTEVPQRPRVYPSLDFSFLQPLVDLQTFKSNDPFHEFL